MTVSSRFTKPVLFVLGGLFWIFGGATVIRTGLPFLFETKRSFPMLIGTAAVFSFFYFFIFMDLAKRHLVRIRTYPEKTMKIWQIFDLRTYLVIVLMSGGGTLLRRLGLLPAWFIGFFYPGLGAALSLRGLFYLISGLRP
jgi:hypothetical protein